jgi:uncharacterized protein with HEPN domain
VIKDDRLYLIHVLERIARIEDYVSGGKDAFLQSSLIQDAVLRNLQTLAESTQRLSEEIKETRADVDWRRIAGFRNVVVHDYLGVDIQYIWRLVEDELPPLKHTISEMLASLHQQEH